MDKPDWKDAPEDAQYLRRWLGKKQWFRRHPTLKNMWEQAYNGSWLLTSMDNCTYISLEPRP